MLRYALGLSLARQKRTPESLKELGDAMRLAPNDARLAYVYAVALNDAGKRKEALDLLRATLKRSPWDRDVLTGLVHFSLQAGDRAEALRYANLLRELDPESQEHAQLAQRVAARPRGRRRRRVQAAVWRRRHRGRRADATQPAAAPASAATTRCVRSASSR